MQNSVLQRIQQLDEEKRQLSEEALEGALAQARLAIEVLEALGHRYTLVPEGKKKTGRSRPRARRSKARASETSGSNEQTHTVENEPVMPTVLGERSDEEDEVV